jgi:hypothetical protein
MASATDREAQPRIRDLIASCEISRQARQDKYGRMRIWYDRGTDKSGIPARFNKLKAALTQQSSYLYNPEGTRFSLGLPPAHKKPWMKHAEVARAEFTRTWRDIGADVMFGEFVKMAGVYGCGIMKLLPEPDHSMSVNWVHPGDFGVLRESVPYLDRQDAVCHWYFLTIPELRQLVAGLPNASSIEAWAEEHATPGSSSEQTGMLQQIIINTSQPSPPIGTFPGGMTPWTQLAELKPQEAEPMVELVEVWERADFKIGDKRLTDYLVSTVIGNWTVMERQNPVLPAVGDWEAELPFIKVWTDPVLDYFWGESALEKILQLQEWRERRMMEIDELYGLQLDPPGFYSGPGMMPMADEKKFTMRTRGALVQGGPQSKMEALRPPMPDQPFELIDRVDGMFDEAIQMPPILKGQNEQGVRAGNQLADLASIASGPVRNKALVVEDAVEVLATRIFHLMQRDDPTAYTTEDGDQFLLAQLPRGTTIKVSAHTSSPIYAVDLADKADRLLKAGAIDLADYVEMLNPPRAEELMEKARVLMKAKAEMVKAKLEIENKKAEKKGR